MTPVQQIFSSLMSISANASKKENNGPWSQPATIIVP